MSSSSSTNAASHHHRTPSRSSPSPRTPSSPSLPVSVALHDLAPSRYAHKSYQTVPRNRGSSTHSGHLVEYLAGSPALLSARAISSSRLHDMNGSYTNCRLRSWSYTTPSVVSAPRPSIHLLNESISRNSMHKISRNSASPSRNGGLCGSLAASKREQEFYHLQWARISNATDNEDEPGDSAMTSRASVDSAGRYLGRLRFPTRFPSRRRSSRSSSYQVSECGTPSADFDERSEHPSVRALSPLYSPNLPIRWENAPNKICYMDLDLL